MAAGATHGGVDGDASEEATLPAPLSRALLALTVFVAAWTLQPHVDAAAQVVGVRIPAPEGSRWGVLAGYNTATHEGVDPYALDLWRVDGATGGTPLLAPIDGRIGYLSSDCLSIRTDEANLLICHVLPLDDLERGDPVVVGQRIGVVAADGEANNNGVAHVHLQLNARDGEWSSGDSLPFAGAYALEGRDFPATAEANAYYGLEVVSTNRPTSTPVAHSVDAGPDRSVAPGESVTLAAEVSGAVQVFWLQQSGPTVIGEVVAASQVTFTAPEEPDAVLTFQVLASGTSGLATDEVRVTVAAPAAPSPEPPATDETSSRGQIVGGEVYHGGYSLIVFGGGTEAELEQAIACPLPSLAVWSTTPEGGFVRYFVGEAPAFVNAPWRALFPAGLPADTPLIVECV